jgi:DNA-binding GntR family transcriptional regulator
LWEKITARELAPGWPINEQDLAQALGVGPAAVRDALRLLAHEHLVEITPRHGLYVSSVDVADLEQISEMRFSLEALGARLAAQRAAADDLVVMEALRQEQTALAMESGADDATAVSRRFFDLDHKFHHAVAQASRNKYLAQTLERLFGLSRRLWSLAPPHLEFLPSSVERHLDLVEAIRQHDADRAEQIMRSHVADFYDQVRQVLALEQELVT